MLKELKKRRDIDLMIVVGGAAALERHSNVLDLMAKDGFECHAVSHSLVEGGNPTAMAKTIGMGVLDFTTIFENLDPDVVILRGDRHEMLGPAVAALNLNIPMAHIEGGDVSGTIDESVRHAISKLAHIHFVTNTEAKKRLLSMGESPRYVFNVGSPELEFVATKKFGKPKLDFDNVGVGSSIDINKPYMMVLNHPVTTEYGSNRANTEALLDAIHEVDMQVIWFWPNVDAGSDEVSKAIRVYREKKQPEHVHFFKYVDAEDFYSLLNGAHCLVGNSSSGIKESSYLGIPAVNIGTRQSNRARARNVVDVKRYRKNDILKSIADQVAKGRYKPSNLYVKDNTAKTIAEKIAILPLYTQKRFHD